MRNFGLQAITIILKIQGLVLLQGRMGLAAGAISAAIHASGVAWDAAWSKGGRGPKGMMVLSLTTATGFPGSCIEKCDQAHGHGKNMHSHFQFLSPKWVGRSTTVHVAVHVMYWWITRLAFPCSTVHHFRARLFASLPCRPVEPMDPELEPKWPLPAYVRGFNPTEEEKTFIICE